VTLGSPPASTSHAPDVASRGEALAAGVTAAGAVGLSVWWKATHLDLPEAYTLGGYSDIAALYGARGLDGGNPWAGDVPLEYPPGTGLLAWAVSGLADTATGFLVLTGVVLAVAAAVATFLLAREVGWRRPLVLLAGPVVWMAGAVNWDLVTVALAVAGLVAHRRGHDTWAGAWLGVGVATKLWPGLLLVAVVPAAWRLRGRGAAVRTAGAAAGAWAALNVPVMLTSFDGWRRFLDLNRERVADWDSLWRLLGPRAGFEPGVPTLNLVVGILTVVGVVGVMVATVRRLPARRWHEAGLALVVVFLVLGKVWSPQFTLWLLPLLALAWPGGGWVTAFTVAHVVTHVARFRYLANFVDGGLPGAWPEWPFLVAVLVRDVVVVAMVAAWWRRATSDVVPDHALPDDVVPDGAVPDTSGTARGGRRRTDAVDGGVANAAGTRGGRDGSAARRAGRVR
jgi:hypothetical protein